MTYGLQDRDRKRNRGNEQDRTSGNHEYGLDRAIHFFRAPRLHHELRASTSGPQPRYFSRLP
jgi:hypothetical protein